MVYDIFFTNRRLVVVMVKSPDDVTFNSSSWKSLIGNWMDKRKEEQTRDSVFQKRLQQEKELSLDELIQAHPQNFEMSYDNVTSVQITRSFFQYQLKLHGKSSLPNPLPRTFNLRKEQVPELQRLIDLVLSEKQPKG
jgi:hypothetical protein